MDPITVLLIIFLLYPVPALIAYRILRYCYKWDPEEFDDPVYDIQKSVKVACTIPVLNIVVLFEVFKHYIDIRRRKRAARKILEGILTGIRKSEPEHSRLKVEEKLKAIIKSLKK